MALGDSLTAGEQDLLLTVEHQRTSYGAVLAARAGVPFALPETRNCPDTAVGAVDCSRLNPGVTVQNLAVPGAEAADLAATSSSTAPAAARGLYQLILGSDTQLSAALKQKPTFALVWVGSNDVLGPLTAGQGTVTTPAAFRAAVASVLTALRAQGTAIVVLTVPDVTRAPVLVPGDTLWQLGWGDASCHGSSSRVSLSVVYQVQPVSCTAGYAVTTAELANAQATVRSYNAALKDLAAQSGAELFDTQPYFPNADVRYSLLPPSVLSDTFSLDGVHPKDRPHAQLAMALARFINDRYGTDISTQ